MNPTNRRLGVVMDPIATINPKKDTTLAFLIEAQARGYQLEYFELNDLYVRDGAARGRSRALTVANSLEHWFELGAATDIALGELDVILMRKDPPFDMEFVYATYLLELAERQGARVINRPASLRNINEKYSIARFPTLCSPTLITRDAARLRDFIASAGKAVLKPLDGMGGSQIFVLANGDPNTSVIIEELTQRETRNIMAQRFIPEISAGDKRILLIDGEAFPHALARIPKLGESRGNLAAGGKGIGQPLSKRDQAICAEIGPWAREQGLLFVGLDVIGDYVTEINVTSPTGLRELEAHTGDNIAALLFDAIERHTSQ